MRYSYFAFISYSRNDRRIAASLHRSLETVRIPANMAKSVPQGLENKVRLEPIFLDTDELPSSASLPRAIEEYLEKSAFLVVVCSPSAAQSTWVDLEIKHFIKLGRADRIFTIVVAGLPATYSELCVEGAFPPALLLCRAEMPLAANLVVEKSHLHREAIRLAAGILGVTFDMLFQRAIRRRRRLLGVVFAACIVVAVPIAIVVKELQASADKSKAEALANDSVVYSQKSDIAYNAKDYRAAVALALEGMPDVDKGIARPIEPKVQAALARAYWNLADILKVMECEIPISVKNSKGGFWCIEQIEDGVHVIKNGDKKIEMQSNILRGVASVNTKRGAGVFAAGMNDGRVKIFDDMGNLRKEFPAHSGPVGRIALSADGGYVASLGEDSRTLRAWTAEGRLSFEKAIGVGAISFAFGASGSVLAVSAGKHAEVMRADGAVLFEINTNGPDATSVAYDARNNLLAVAFEGAGIRIFSSYGVEMFSLRVGIGDPEYLEFSEDGSRLLAEDSFGNVGIYETGTRRELAVYRPPMGSRDLRSSFAEPDGSSVLLPYFGYLWSVVPRRYARYEVFEANDADVSFDAARVVVGSSDNYRLKRFDAGGKAVEVWSGHEGNVWMVRSSPDGRRFVTASSDGTARIWMVDGKKPVVLAGHKGGVWDAQFSPDGDRVVTTSSDGTSRLWGSDGRLISELRANDFPIGVGLSDIDTDKFIVSESAPHLWRHARFSRSGKYIVTVSGDHAARLWTGRGEFIATLGAQGGRVFDADFNRSEDEVVTSGDNGQVTFWSVSGVEVGRFVTGSRVRKVRYVGGGSDVFLIEWSASAEIRSKQGKLVQKIFGGSEPINDADISADGEKVVVATGDALRVLDAKGNSLFSVDRPFRSVKFGLDGSVVIAVDESEVAVIRTFALGQELVSLAKAKLVDCLYPHERAKYNMGDITNIADDDIHPAYCK